MYYGVECDDVVMFYLILFERCIVEYMTHNLDRLNDIYGQIDVNDSWSLILSSC